MAPSLSCRLLMIVLLSRSSLPRTRTPEDFAHVPVLIFVAWVVGPFAPAVIAAELPEQAGCDHGSFVDRLFAIAVRRDVQRVGWTVQLTHITRLTVRLARDDREASRDFLEHVRRAGSDARVALGAAIFDEQLDHATTLC